MEDENTEHIDTEHIDEVFVDTNVLVYLRQKQSPFQEASRQRLNDLEKGEVGRWISRQIVREYLAAMTRITDLLQFQSVNWTEARICREASFPV